MIATKLLTHEEQPNEFDLVDCKKLKPKPEERKSSKKGKSEVEQESATQKMSVCRRKGMVCMHKMKGLAFPLNDETEKLSMNVSR